MLFYNNKEEWYFVAKSHECLDKYSPHERDEFV